MILVDTSVWVDHFRKSNASLSELLSEGAVFCHPFVIGELACGNLRNRDEILGLLAALPEAHVAEHEETLHLVKHHRLHGHGLGWIDAHLIASALLNRCNLWTSDKLLDSAARALKISV
jgi:predicted nucleic acid-binding protein